MLFPLISDQIIGGPLAVTCLSFLSWSQSPCSQSFSLLLQLCISFCISVIYHTEYFKTQVREMQGSLWKPSNEKVVHSLILVCTGEIKAKQ